MENFEGMSKMIILTSCIVFYAYLIGIFIAWYSGNKYEYDQFLYRANGDYAFFYWTMMFCNGIVPHALWFKKNKKQPCYIIHNFFINKCWDVV